MKTCRHCKSHIFFAMEWLERFTDAAKCAFSPTHHHEPSRN